MSCFSVRTGGNVRCMSSKRRASTSRPWVRSQPIASAYRTVTWARTFKSARFVAAGEGWMIR